MKKFVVIGLGSFGINIAKALSENGNEVLAIDYEMEKVNAIKDYVAHAIQADATKKEVLEELDLKDSDAVIVSIGPNMEPSIFTVHYLKQLKVENVIAKALSEDHMRILEIVGANNVVYPERDEAIRLANILSSTNILEYLPISNDFSIEEIAPPSEFIGKSLRQLDLRKKYNVLVIGIRDTLKDEILIASNPDEIIKESDSLIVAGRRKDLEKLSSF
ncbi:MAG: potassium channel family protein [Candidatus Aminicenantia bacterium]